MWLDLSGDHVEGRFDSVHLLRLKKVTFENLPNW